MSQPEMQSLELEISEPPVLKDVSRPVDPQSVFDKTSIEVMPTEQFVKIPINTKQRDTALRAQTLESHGGGHLSQLLPEHLIFSIVRDPEGNEMKLDGHTRTYMYEQGWYPLPDSVYVLVIAVDSMDEASERYDSYDSSSAAKTAANNMQSAYRVNNFKPDSKWIREAKGIKVGLGWASSFALGQIGQPVKEDAVALVRNYLDELKIIDDMEFTHKQLPPQYLAPMIAIIRKHKEEALPFLEKYKAGNAAVENGEQNSIQIITTYMKSEPYIKLKDKKTTKPSTKFTTPSAVFVNAFNQWHSNPSADWSAGADIDFNALRTGLIIS